MVKMQWLPGWAKNPLGGDVRGKLYQFVENPKCCLHTTEGTSIAGAIGAYAPYPPHGIYDWQTRVAKQHIPLDLASYSAMDGNDDDFMVQIELVGFAHDTRNWPDIAYRNIAADVIGPIADAFGVPPESIDKQWLDDTDGVTIAHPNSPLRITPAQLRDFSGWLGHQHLPAPDSHWDPGALDIGRLIRYGYNNVEDDMTPDEAALLANVAHNVERINAFLSITSDAPVNPADGERETLFDAVWQAAAEEKARDAAALKAAVDSFAGMSNVLGIISEKLDKMGSGTGGSVTKADVQKMLDESLARLDMILKPSAQPL